jgi:hypothetical protein
MNSLKSLLLRIKLRIYNWFNTVPYPVHLEALTTIEKMTITEDNLNKVIELLERQIRQRDLEIAYLTQEKEIDQNFIVDLLGKILKYTDVPEAEVKALENKVTQAKALARKNYGRV